jgi:hypothetical protein
MLETLLDKGVVVNADIAVTVGDTELLGVRIRAAIASFETAAQYGLEFPGGTDMDRVADAAGIDPVESGDEVPIRTPSTPSAGGDSVDADGGRDGDDGTGGDGQDPGAGAHDAGEDA